MRPPEEVLSELSAVEREALRWSVRAANGLDDKARAALEAWLAAAPSHRRAFDELRQVWGAVDEIPAALTAGLRAQVAIERARQLPAARPSRRRFAVAGLAAALVAVAGWMGWQHYEAQPVFSQRYETTRGVQMEIPLPDGSRVALDTASQAGVAFYRDRREVRLAEGRALFDVRAEPARPFAVLAGAARVTVMGTRFSVRFTPSSHQGVHVGVVEGRVHIAGAAQGGSVTLAAGEAVVAHADGRLGPVASIGAEAIAAWREQRLDFHNAPLAEVVAELARYGVDNVRADAVAGNLPVTASIDLRRLGDFLKGLPKVMPVRVEWRDGEAVITGRAR